MAPLYRPASGRLSARRRIGALRPVTCNARLDTVRQPFVTSLSHLSNRVTEIVRTALLLRCFAAPGRCVGFEEGECNVAESVP
jgi:hypothetical protein